MKKHKKDMSLHVHQRDKLKQPLSIRSFPWTPKQQEFLKLALEKNTRIIFVTGPAGSAKTLLAAYASLVLLNEHHISDVIYIRSAVESADRSLGFMPGPVDEKMSYYETPLLDKLEELLTKQQVIGLIKEKRTAIMPVNFVRGQSWNARVAIVDEAQNLTQKELYTTLTRLGKFSRCYVLADPSQSDINGKSGGFVKLRDHYATEKGKAHGIHQFQMDYADIMRDDLTRYLVEEYEKIR
jgi:phosphate starvation-inducible PhoH-like protein